MMIVRNSKEPLGIGNRSTEMNRWVKETLALLNAYSDDEVEMAGESEWSWRMTSVVDELEAGVELGSWAGDW